MKGDTIRQAVRSSSFFLTPKGVIELEDPVACEATPARIVAIRHQIQRRKATARGPEERARGEGAENPRSKKSTTLTQEVVPVENGSGWKWVASQDAHASLRNGQATTPVKARRQEKKDGGEERPPSISPWNDPPDWGYSAFA